MAYIPEVEKKLDEISAEKQLERADVEKMYGEILNSDYVQKDPQFTDDKARQMYALRVLNGRFLNRTQTLTCSVMPVGFAGVRKTKTGKVRSSIYAMLKTEKQAWALREITCWGDASTLYKTVQPFMVYNNVQLTQNQNDPTRFGADNRTVFQNPIKPKYTPSQVLEQMKVKRVTCSTMKNFPTKNNDQGYQDTLDIRVCRAIVYRKGEGQREDETKWFNYTFVDETIGQKEEVDSEGKIIYPGISAWVPEELFTYVVDDECDFIGTVKVTNGVAVMNCIGIVPVHVHQKS